MSVKVERGNLSKPSSEANLINGIKKKPGIILKMDKERTQTKKTVGHEY